MTNYLVVTMSQHSDIIQFFTKDCFNIQEVSPASGRQYEA